MGFFTVPKMMGNGDVCKTQLGAGSLFLIWREDHKSRFRTIWGGGSDYLGHGP